MSITEKQLAANRANAKKSTGPRTPEGKSKSSENALTHGVLAKAILIKGESREGFLNLYEAYCREYNPQTPTEHALVHKAITAHWRVLRAASFETAALTHEILHQAESTVEEDRITRGMLAAQALHQSSAWMERLSLYQHRFDLQHRHAIRDLQRMRAEKMDLNKRTHFDEATKELTEKKPISKPIFEPSEAA